MTRPFQLVLVVSLLTALGWTVSTAGAAVPTAAVVPASTPAKPTVTPSQRATSGDIWWNQGRIVDALELRAEQRAQMDELLSKAREAQSEFRSKQNERREVFDESLQQGDWDAAKKASAELAKLAGGWLERRAELKIAVLRLLDSDQREKLAAEFPRVLRQPWVRPARDGGRMGRRGGMRPRRRP